jgi:hypothetical protein
VRTGSDDLFFSSLRWRFENSRPEHPEAGELHNHTLALALSHIVQTTSARRVRIRFARMQGLSEESISRRFIRDVELGRAHMVRQLGMPTIFPIITAEPVGPEHPGIQVADHLLWSERRKTPNGGTALEALGFTLEYESVTDGPFTVRHYTRHNITIASKPIRPWPITRSAEHFRLLVDIERIVHQVARVRPERTRHLEYFVVPASKRARDRAHISDKEVSALCEAFLLVVDTLPCYDASDQPQAAIASEAAAFAAQVALGSETRVVSIVDRWCTQRAGIVRAGEGAYLFGEGA